MHGVESVGQPQEVRRRLGGAPDPGELSNLVRLDAELVERFDDTLGDGIMAAAGTERGLAALIFQNLQAQAVDLFGARRHSGAHLPSCRITSSVTVRASSGRPP